MDGSLIPFLLMLGVFYFLIIRPQVKEKEEHDALIAALVKDDRVVTASGIHGRVVSVDEHTVSVEISKNTNITLDKSAVVRKLGGDADSKR